MKPSYLKTGLYTIATTTLLLCSAQNHAQQYYKWVDANGSTHYTTTPPPKGAKRLDKVSTYGGYRSAPPPSNPATNSSAQPAQGAQDASQRAVQVVNPPTEGTAPIQTPVAPAQAPAAPSSARPY